MLADMGSMFVPTDKAIKEYFTNPSNGGYNIMKLYAKKPIDNDDDHFAENLDSIPSNIIRSFVNNLMNTSFVQSVPSKFGTIMDEASDPIGITTGDISKDANGSYDVRIANNGAIYMLDRVVPPISYNIVSTPALLRKARDLGVINWAIQDKSTLKVNFYAYLRASTANYALFLPDNHAFCGEGDFYYVDPVSLGKNYKGGPRVLHFYYKDVNKDNTISASAFKYDPTNGSISEDSTIITSVSEVADRLIDILNYHTISLAQGEKFGTNKFYKTKHGGEIAISGAGVGATVKSGGQIHGMAGMNSVLPASEIKEATTDYSNGSTFVINHVIQAPQTSVFGCLSNHSQFSKFMDLCMPADLSSILTNIGIKSSEQKQFTMFTNQFDTNVNTNRLYDCLDYNVAFFNTYNYTLYAPNNDAMDEAFKRGLPTWEQVQQVLAEAEHGSSDQQLAAKAKAKDMVEAIRNFIRYHFQDFALYADNTVDFGDAPKDKDGKYSFQTSCVDGTIYKALYVSGGSDKLYVTDLAGNTITINGNEREKLVNYMTRDYTFYKSEINTSSFAAIHEISEPLCINKSKRYDDRFASNTEADKKASIKRLNALYYAQKHGQKYYK